VLVHGAPRLLAARARVALDADAAAHARALRVRAGQRLRVFFAAEDGGALGGGGGGGGGNGGGEWLGELQAGGASVALERQLRAPPSLREARAGALLFAPPLERARAGFLVEKATELGARAIVPLVAERAEHLARGGGSSGGSGGAGEDEGVAVFGAAALAAERPRLRVSAAVQRAWARGAAEQSERLTLPLIGAPLRLREVLEGGVGAGSGGGLMLLFCDEALAGEAAAPTVGDAARAWRAAAGEAAAAGGGGSSGAVGVLIGPEGGWSDEERALARSFEGGHRVVRVSLGPLVLRAETAALAALAALADLGMRCA